jgi:hypothetical protein
VRTDIFIPHFSAPCYGAAGMNSFMKPRRVLCAAFLFVAVVMLVLGLSVLKQRLGPLAALIYWCACLFATAGAVVCALLDLGRSLRESRSEQRALLEATLHDIEAAQARRRNPSGCPPPESR